MSFHRSPPYAEQLFERELQARGIAFVRVEPDLYRIEVEGRTSSVSISNLLREVARDGDKEVIARFVEQVIRQPDLPPWQEARLFVRFSAERFDLEFTDALHDSVSKTVGRVLALTDSEESLIRWLTADDLRTWGVTEEEARRVAAANMDRLLDGIVFEVEEIDGMKLAMVPLDSVFKASVIFAPSLKKHAQRELGWPVLATVPCRDFIYLVPDADRALLGRMGSVVQREFRQSPYPLTTEVLLISDDGIKAIGAFPE